jgi:hypothetical protein
VSSFGCARVHQAARSAAFVGIAFALSLIASAATVSPANAQAIKVGGCIGGGWIAINCVTLWTKPIDPFVRSVPQPTTRENKVRAREHDRRWVDRCRPLIRQDRYGVARYSYAQPGCEFGVGEQ